MVSTAKARSLALVTAARFEFPVSLRFGVFPPQTFALKASRCSGLEPPSCRMTSPVSSNYVKFAEIGADGRASGRANARFRTV